MTHVVDSSCWLEYFNDSDVGNIVAPIIKDISNLIVPSIVYYEVFKKLLIEKNEDSAIFAVAHMKQGITVDIDYSIAILAAKNSKELKLSMADSLIYTITQINNAILWTQDAHFEKFPSVKYFQK